MSRKKSRLELPEGYRADQAGQGIWVYLEHRDGEFASVSLELLGKGRKLADQAGVELSGLLLGDSVETLGESAISFGADEVCVIEDPRLAAFNLEAFSDLVCQAVQEGKPGVLLLGATHDGRDLAGRLAVRLQTGLNADCTELVLDPARGVLISEVTGFGGGIIALLECPDRRPQMSTVRPGVFPLPERNPARKGRVLRIATNITDEIFATTVLEKEERHTVDLTQADTLVCGGRGMDGDFDSLRELASVLGGDVGGTRPPVDDGYIERERQIGQTGVVCHPKVALCLGISGAFHFVVGIEQADLVIAVNSDPEAPIFEYADYGIVADVHDFIPALLGAFESYRERAHA
ncbi:MAG: electron transfer flavoprotein subunit alpha/FixB family protein [Anaerolineales bacterium]|jgi:electron transfer flavoprotein alpha subunit